MPRWLRRRRLRRLADRSDAEWLEALRTRSEAELAELRLVLVEALRPVLHRKVPAQADALAQDFAQEALLHILDRLDTFRGEARFTTWAAKVAARLAFSELRRLRWKDVSLDDLLSERPEHPAAQEEAAPTPEDVAMTQERVALVRALVAEVLTERQQVAIEAVMLHGMPLEEVARRMDTNRNALYKLLHDARQRLKQALEARGPPSSKRAPSSSSTSPPRGAPPATTRPTSLPSTSKRTRTSRSTSSRSTSTGRSRSSGGSAPPASRRSSCSGATSASGSAWPRRGAT